MSYENGAYYAKQTDYTKIVIGLMVLGLLLVAGLFATFTLTDKESSLNTRKKTKPARTRSTGSQLNVQDGNGGLQNRAGGAQGAISPSQNNFTAQ